MLEVCVSTLVVVAQENQPFHHATLIYNSPLPQLTLQSLLPNPSTFLTLTPEHMDVKLDALQILWKVTRAQMWTFGQ
jgi:hypothetical protein